MKDEGSSLHFIASFCEFTIISRQKFLFVLIAWLDVVVEGVGFMTTV